MAISMCNKKVFTSSLKKFYKGWSYSYISLLFEQGILTTYIEVKLQGTLQEAKDVCLIVCHSRKW